MPYIKEINTNTAKGLLKKQLVQALKFAGRIWNIVRIMSIHPEALKDSMSFYRSLMHGGSPLSRSHREILAVVVSSTNQYV